MSDIITITLPWPSSDLSPNSRNRWKKITATKEARALAHYLTRNELAASVTYPFFNLKARLKISMTFNAPDKRHFDLDGLISRMKPAADGIFDAIGNNDRQIEVIEARLKPVIKGGRVQITLTEFDDDPGEEMQF